MNAFKHFVWIAVAAMVMVGCSSSKHAVDSKITKQTSLEGEKVMVETAKMQGIEMVEGLSEGL